jgi:hypothetical protein
VIYALTFAPAHRRIIRWARDWRWRRELQPWMLANVAESHRQCGNDGIAADVSRHALRLQPDCSFSIHRMWLAADQALYGDAVAARELLAEVNRNSLQSDGQLLIGMVDALQEIRLADVSRREDAFHRARSRLRQVKGQRRHVLKSDRARRRFYRRAVWRIARERGGSIGFAWALFRLLIV